MSLNLYNSPNPQTKSSGKKLLVLGGKPIGFVDIVQYAKELGSYVIVCAQTIT